MAAPDRTGFLARFPQFAATDTDTIDIWLAEAAVRFNAARFGAQWAMAAYYYTAHQLVLFDPDAADASEQHLATGNVTSRKIADLARSYASTLDMARVPSSLMPFTATTYGQQLIGIILSRRHAHARVVRTGSSRAADTTDAADSGS